MKKLLLEISSIFVIVFFTPVAYGFDSSIHKDNISLKSKTDLKNDPPTFYGFSESSDSYQSVATLPVGQNKAHLNSFLPMGASKSSPSHIPCSSPDASNKLVLAPPDAPGVTRDKFGQAYLCEAKTPDGQPADPVEYTLPNGETVAAPEPIIVTTEDFQNLGILPSAAHQERAPHTLKNYNTNFWASPQEQTFDIEMGGGVPVQVRAIPISYTFTYGDGQTLNTTNPGYQLGEDVWDQETPTSHKYAEPGDYNYSVTTYYRGEFSVAGGPWQVIDGTGEATNDPQLVRVWRVKAGLVADDCAANPGAWGCSG